MLFKYCAECGHKVEDIRLGDDDCKICPSCKRIYGRNPLPVVEVLVVNELNEVLRVGGVNRIMLDNFDFATTRRAVEIINGRYETESSGGITFDTLRSYAECGVDFISVGALTHSVKSLDMSLKAIK